MKNRHQFRSCRLLISGCGSLLLVAVILGGLLIGLGLIVHAEGWDKPAPTPTADPSIMPYLNITPIPMDVGVPYIKGKIIIINIDKKQVARFMKQPELSSLVATATDEVGTIIWLHYHTEKMGMYTNGQTATQQFCDITIIDKAWNRMVGNHTHAGPNPPEEIHNGWEAYGGDISDSDIVKYVLSLSRK